MSKNQPLRSLADLGQKRKCAMCGETKPITDFTGGTGKIVTRCHPCFRIYNREKQRMYYHARKGTLKIVDKDQPMSSTSGFYGSFGEALKNKREALALDVPAMAEVLGMSVKTYRLTESGTHQLQFEDGIRIVKLLQIRFSYLDEIVDVGVEKDRLTKALEESTKSADARMAELEKELQALKDRKVLASRLKAKEQL